MKKGFTLIELLAVIVILAIIALIATPIVLNIINDTKESATLRSADFYLDAVELSIAQSVLENKNITDGTYSIMNDGNICIGTLTNDSCTGTIMEVDINGEVPTGTITIESGNISDISLSINTKTIVKNKKGELVYKEPVCVYKDEDNSGTINLSDVVTCGKTESFYVVSNENNEITMLAKYNLDLTTNLQSATTTDTVKFASNSYYGSFPNWSSIEYIYSYGDYKNSNGVQQNLAYPHVNSYETYLKSSLGLNSVSALLMSYEQATDLKNNKGNPSWLYTTQYWLGSTMGIFIGTCVDTNQGITTCYTGDSPDAVLSGVRPIVTISASEI